MTREHLLLMDVNEIIGIRWECSKCHSAITYKLTETIRLPQGCACGETYTNSDTFGDYENATAFVARLKALVTGTPNLKAILRLELKDTTR